MTRDRLERAKGMTEDDANPMRSPRAEQAIALALIDIATSLRDIRDTLDERADQEGIPILLNTRPGDRTL